MEYRSRIDERIPSLLSTDWLADHLGAENLIVVDATMPKVGASEVSVQSKQISGAVFMDLKNNWGQKEAPFPNTMLAPEDFEKAAREMGVNRDSVLVFYDDHGIYSSARAWWMFRSMGHSQAAVLNGGLPAWLRREYPVEEKKHVKQAEGDFIARPMNDGFVDYRMVQSILQNKNFRILDARAEDRFKGTVEEPRPGLRSGHIPGSENLPYTFLLTDGVMKDPEELDKFFRQNSGDAENLIFSCGSGITACVLALGAEQLGWKKMSVYDGSWTEWGSLKELPIERS